MSKSITLASIVSHSRDARPTSGTDYAAIVTDALSPIMASTDVANLGTVAQRVGDNIAPKKATDEARLLRTRIDSLTKERRYLRSRLNAGGIDQAMHDTLYACLTQCIDLMTLRRSALILVGQAYDAANPAD